ncbi:fimbrial protein YehD [Klebsiella spallanzanii]|uniref:fimbrial protein YehD n=1 Tax=Klebsiella spallanzanii TaxID=2587528 RepID=UPI00115AD3ED|nr:fimbrial protein YehD [Klebsiella spallanzanii]VUS35635.1 putative fimbrial-like protein YehD [Klebsiella spallanzanii]
MRKSMIAAVVLSSLFSAQYALAADTEEGTLQINGVVLPTTCKFVDGNSQATITMAPVGKAQFTGMSAGQSYTGYSNDANQELKLKCEGNKVPNISFVTTGFVDAYPTITTATGGASGVGYTLKLNGNAVNPREGVKLTANETGEYDLVFSAQYAITTAPGDVQAGNVNSTVVMQVNTD